MSNEKEREAMRRWLKALGRLDDGRVYWWFTGVTYGLTPEAGLQPLFRHENFSFGPYRRTGEQRHESVMEDIVFYRDLDNGGLLRELTNPYTGETVAVIEVLSNAINNFYDIDGKSGFIADGQEIIQPLDLEFTAAGHDLWMKRSLDWSLPNPIDPSDYPLAYSGPMIRMQMETHLRVDREAVTNPDTQSVAASASYEAITPWFPWLHMGSRPGHLVTRAVGFKLASYQDLPADVFRLAEERFPGCVTERQKPPHGNGPWMDYLRMRQAQ